MKTIINCTECNHSYEGIENDDLISPHFSLKENQINFHKIESWTHKYILYKKLESIDNKEYTDNQKQEWISRRREFEKSITSYNCNNQYENNCEFTGSLIQILEHEKTCMGINNISNNNIIKENEKYIKCDICGKKFYDYPNRKLKIQHQMNQHRQTCRKTCIKKLKKKLHNFIDEIATDDDIYKLRDEYDII